MKKYVYNVAYIAGKDTNVMSFHCMTIAVNTPFATEKQFNELIVFLQRKHLTKNIVMLNIQLIEERKIDKPLTHYDDIMAMSINGIESFIRSVSLGFDPWCDRHCKMQGEDNCNTCLAKWLNSEVRKDESNL